MMSEVIRFAKTQIIFLFWITGAAYNKKTESYKETVKNQPNQKVKLADFWSTMK